MEAYRYQQFAYLVIPLIAGIEFFRCARSVRKSTGRESAAAVSLDACGYLFITLIPALFFFTILSLEYRRFPIIESVLHRLDRYGVMFMFLGAWWQVFLITALRAKRVAIDGGSMLPYVWVPYLVLGFYVSALILWVAPFKLMWFSIFWFLASFGLFFAVKMTPNKAWKIFFIFAFFVFMGENILFIILDAIV